MKWSDEIWTFYYHSSYNGGGKIGSTAILNTFSIKLEITFYETGDFPVFKAGFVLISIK